MDAGDSVESDIINLVSGMAEEDSDSDIEIIEVRCPRNRQCRDRPSVIVDLSNGSSISQPEESAAIDAIAAELRRDIEQLVAQSSQFLPQHSATLHVSDQLLLQPGQQISGVVDDDRLPDDNELEIVAEFPLLQSTRRPSFARKRSRHEVWEPVDDCGDLPETDESLEAQKRREDFFDNRLPTVRYRSPSNRCGDPTVPTQECSICLADFVADEQLKFLPCSHGFHAGCVKAYILKKMQCPVCLHTVKGCGWKKIKKQQ